MKLNADFLKDWDVAIRHIMEVDWGMDLSKAKAEDIPALFYHAGYRRIQPIPRTIELAATFVCPADLQSGWDALRAKIEAGDDLSPHLSLLVKRADAKDGLLFDWGVYHLHLGLGTHPKDPEFTDRTGPVLFGHPTDDKFYAIGIYAHGAWSDKSVIDTLHANWPSVTARHTLQFEGEVEVAHKVTDEERELLRRAGINTFTAMDDGSILGSVGGGFATNGISINAVRAADRMRDQISKVQKALSPNEAKIKQMLVAEDYDGESDVVAHLEFGPEPKVTFVGFGVSIPVSF